MDEDLKAALQMSLLEQQPGESTPAPSSSTAATPAAPSKAPPPASAAPQTTPIPQQAPVSVAGMLHQHADALECLHLSSCPGCYGESASA